MAEPRPAVLVYREQLGHPSEPFIPAQGEGLERYLAHYLAIRPAAGQGPPAERVIPWPSGRAAPALRYAWKRWGFAPSVTRALDRIGVAVAHAHFGRDAVQLLPWIRRRRVPLVVTFHGHDATRSDEAFRRGSYSDRLFVERRRELASVAARTIAVSGFIAEQLRTRGYPDERIEVHYIGVDSGRIGEHRAVVRDDELVAFVGRLVEHKGVFDFLDALATVAHRRPEIRAVMVGDGELRAALEDRARALRLPVTFTGAVPPAEVWRHMGRAAVVVAPSKSNADGWSEGFGLVAAEAQAAGAAIVASRNGGLPEAVAPPFHDHLVAPGDPAAIAAQVLRLLGDPAERAARADEATAWVATHRDLTRQTRRLESIYDEVRTG